MRRTLSSIDWTVIIFLSRELMWADRQKQADCCRHQNEDNLMWMTDIIRFYEIYPESLVSNYGHSRNEIHNKLDEWTTCSSCYLFSPFIMLIRVVLRWVWYQAIKGSRTGHFVKVSLWYASLLTNTRFRYLYFRISNC